MGSFGRKTGLGHWTACNGLLSHTKLVKELPLGMEPAPRGAWCGLGDVNGAPLRCTVHKFLLTAFSQLTHFSPAVCSVLPEPDAGCGVVKCGAPTS